LSYPTNVTQCIKNSSSNDYQNLNDTNQNQTFTQQQQQQDIMLGQHFHHNHLEQIHENVQQNFQENNKQPPPQHQQRQPVQSNNSARSKCKNFETGRSKKCYFKIYIKTNIKEYLNDHEESKLTLSSSQSPSPSLNKA